MTYFLILLLLLVLLLFCLFLYKNNERVMDKKIEPQFPSKTPEPQPELELEPRMQSTECVMETFKIPDDDEVDDDFLRQMEEEQMLMEEAIESELDD